ncbi:MAG: DsbA family protein [Pseudomonadota bacterium]
MLRVYFHFRSPYSRLGLHKIARKKIAERTTLSLHVFTGPADGAAFLNPTESKPKLRYIFEDAPRMTMRMGLQIMPPMTLDPDYRPSIAAFYAAREQGAALAFALAVSDARWGKGADISDHDVLSECAKEAGINLSRIGERSVAEDEALDRASVERDGVFGVPFATLEDNSSSTHHLWGQDRFDLLDELAS